MKYAPISHFEAAVSEQRVARVRYSDAMRLVVLSYPPGCTPQDLSGLVAPGDIHRSSDLRELLQRCAGAQLIATASTPLRREILDYFPAIRTIFVPTGSEDTLVELPIAQSLGVHVVSVNGGPEFLTAVAAQLRSGR